MVKLSDKYTETDGRVFISGTQALVRLPMVQARRDRDAGLNTAGFITGYRGSPLGGYDMELTRSREHLAAHNVTFEPGLNEDLAMTAIWGTQQVDLSPHKTTDGVFGIWYGKGPGVDRSMDPLRHGAAAGSSPLGGVLCIAGDDHGCKSSTLPHQTDHNFMAAFVPLLYPSGVHEFVEFGLLGLAMSRYSGCWTGMKVVSETVETSATVDLKREQRPIILPDDFDMPAGGLNIRWPDAPRDQDYRLQRHKGFAALAFARANGIDRMVWDSPNPRFGIMTSGKSYLDVRQALYELGITEDLAKEIGLRVYKVGMPWPLEPEGARHFCEGLEEVLVVEEKREMIEHQLKWQLFNWKADVRPRVVGKHDEVNQWMLPPENDLSVGQIAHVIAKRLATIYDSKVIREKLDYFRSRQANIANFTAPIARVPYYCSGCPHNTSTKVPEGSRAMVGIGCHYMVQWMDRRSEFFTQMGGEGATWIGQSPFTDEKHVFQNLGDGTYQHSGLLAIRAAVAANVNITYKILYNDAVAMTGGQPVEGGLTVEQIAAQMQAEGVSRVAIASETPERFAAAQLPRGVAVHHRDDFDALQLEFREIEGVSILIYDQICAAEKRRRRKRGLMIDPPKRAFINARVCEGCGDCSVQSNCVSIEPLETEFGRKRTINQSTCNKDMSCLKGFCPSFVTVDGGTPRRSSVSVDKARFDALPEPHPAALDRDYNILVTGIGGTGVLTVGSILGMAAHIEGKASKISDMTGLAQKGGAVYSHVRLGPDNDTLRSARIITGGADLLLACDNVVAASEAAANLLNLERTTSIVNSHQTPVADFVLHRNLDFHERQVIQSIEARSATAHVIPATEIATSLTGDSIATNTFIVGYALQKGLIPLKLSSVIEAIRLNGVAVEANLNTLNWGRLMAHDEAAVLDLLGRDQVMEAPAATDLDDIIAIRRSELTAYQNAGLADRYTALVARVREAEKLLKGQFTALSVAVARFYAKLLAYKDEYEVARFYTDGTFAADLKKQFEGDVKLTFHLAPPLLGGVDKVSGRPKKRAFGPWVLTVFRLLAKAKGLRGTVFDPFGYHPDRRVERQLITDYEKLIDDILAGLTVQNVAVAVDLASLPDQIRGYGPVKAASLARVAAVEQTLRVEFKTGRRDPMAA